MLGILIAIIVMSIIAFIVFAVATDDLDVLKWFGIVIGGLLGVLLFPLLLATLAPWGYYKPLLGPQQLAPSLLGFFLVFICAALFGILYHLLFSRGVKLFDDENIMIVAGIIFFIVLFLYYICNKYFDHIMSFLLLSSQIIFLGIAIGGLAFFISYLLFEKEIFEDHEVSCLIFTPISLGILSSFILPISINGWDALIFNNLDVWKHSIIITHAGFLQILLGMLLFAVIVPFLVTLFILAIATFGDGEIAIGCMLILPILVISAPIGYIFVTDQPAIYLNDIGDGMIGDKILVSGNAIRLNGHEIKILFVDNTAKTEINTTKTKIKSFYSTPKILLLPSTRVSNGGFSATFDTSSLDGGKYKITAICENISDSKTFHLFSSLAEKISTEKSVYIKGSPIKVIVALKNPHKEEREINLNLQLDNKVVKTEFVSIPPEGFKNINFTLDDVDVGMHEVSVGGYEASFEVKPVPFIRLNQIEHDVGIGNPLTISGTSNLPDDTKIEITIKDGVILAQKTVNILNGRFSIEIDTSKAKEGIYNVIAEEPVRKLSDSTEVKLYVQYWDIKTIDLSVSPSTVIVGDEVTVEVTLKNTGNIAGTRQVSLNIDGRAVESKTVTMHPSKMDKVAFTISTTQSDVGRHTISVDDKTAILTVKPTPKIDLDEIGDVKVGDELSVSGSTNLEDGTELLIVIKSDGYHFEPAITRVKNGRFTEKLDTSDAIEGIYKITVKDVKVIHGAKDVGSVFLFSTKPKISISLSVSSKEILVGGTEKIFVRVTNSGDKKEAITLSLIMDSMLKDTQTISVEADSFDKAIFEIHNPDIGEHIIDVNGYKTMFSVTAPTPILPHISSDRLSIDLYSTKTVVSRGENIIVTLSAVNKITNDKDLHLQLILAVPSGISATSSEGAFSIAGGQATFDKVLKPGDTISGITLNLVPNEVGSYTIKGDVIYQVGDEKFDEEVCLPIFVGS